MRGRYDSTQARFDLDEARVSLGSEEAPGPVLNIAGIFDHDPLSRGWLIDADATLEDVPVAELDTYWPRSVADNAREWRSEEHTSELQSLMRMSYAVFCLKKKNIMEHRDKAIYNIDAIKHKDY